MGNAFVRLYGEKSLSFAIELLNNALKNENDSAVRAEIERRLKILNPTQINVIPCSGCKKKFQPRKIRKYKQNFCDDCLKAKYGLRQ